MKIFITLHIAAVVLLILVTNSIWESIIILFAVIGALEMVFFNYLAYKIKKEHKGS